MSAEQAIYRMGYRRILSVRPRKAQLFEQILSDLIKKRISDREVMEFTYELAQLLGSGIALMKALDFVNDVTKNKSLKKMIEIIIDSINNGNSFSQAISEQEGVFSETYVQVIRASEKSGNLERGLIYMADFMSKTLEARKRFRRLFTYPSVILLLAAAVASFIVFYIVPSMTDVFNSMNVELPSLTMGLINMSNFIINNALLLFTSAVCLVFVAWIYLRTERGRRDLDTWLLRIPFIKDMVKSNNLLTYFNMSAMLLKAGIKLPQVLYYSGNTVGNSHLRDILLKSRAQLLQGKTLVAVSRQMGILNRMEVEKIAIGERTGDVAAAFEYIAEGKNRVIEEKRAAFVAIIEPVITICIGVVVALIALSTILPMYSLAGSLG
jgi:general secretion pathway protein F